MWLVARHQYLTMVRKRSFILVTLGFPVLIALVMAIAIFFSRGSQDQRPVGYVDQADLLHPTADQDAMLDLRAFETLDDAKVALEAGEIQAVYLLPGDYLQSGRVQLYYWDDPPGDAARSRFRRLLRDSLADGVPADLRERAIGGAELVIRSADGRRQVGQDEWLAVVLPLLSGVLFMLAIMTSAGYLLQAVTTEKENRTMEVMITSLTPEQLIGGKAIGLMGVSLSQLGVWVVTVGIAAGIVTRGLKLVPLGQVPWSTLGVILAFFVPGYALVGGIMAAIGSAVTDRQQGQQVAAILNILFMAPFFLIAVILAQPNSPLMVAFTLFPLTAFLTVVLRWSVAQVPWWQLAASWLLLVASAGGSLWAAARILRAGMLRYGQRLDLRAVWAALRARPALAAQRRN
jgi:ABC-2 type transport system permease protein